MLAVPQEARDFLWSDLYQKLLDGVAKKFNLGNEQKKNLDEFIYQYLTDNLRPDYNWGPELHDFYRKDVENHGFYAFDIDDQEAYTYYGDEWGKPEVNNRLVIEKWIAEELTSIFGNLWIPIFIKWFEDGSGLKVKNFEIETI